MVRLFLNCLLVIGLSTCASAQQSGYVVSQRTRLTISANRVDGGLEVLTDERLSSNLQKDMWGNGDWSMALNEKDSLFAEFKARPPRNAQLRIVNAANHPLQTVELERPLARIRTQRLAAEGSSFLVAVDYSVGFGSYAGVTTLLLDIQDGKFHWVEALNSKTGQHDRIALPDTLKSAWRLVPYQRGEDILQVLCRPAYSDKAKTSVNFTLYYIRYHYDGKQWMKFERLRAGMWESDEPFPASTAFPGN